MLVICYYYSYHMLDKREGKTVCTKLTIAYDKYLLCLHLKPGSPWHQLGFLVLFC